jgi:hypothetical protein
MTSISPSSIAAGPQPDVEQVRRFALSLPGVSEEPHFDVGRGEGQQPGMRLVSHENSHPKSCQVAHNSK